jgi:hypothetical protein
LFTGSRARAADATYTTGAGRFIPQHLSFDTRSVAPANSLIMGDIGNNPFGLYSVDYAAGTRTLLSSANFPFTSSAPDYPLDSANGRVLVTHESAFNRYVVRPMDVATGTLGAAIADSAVDTPTFGRLNAMTLDSRAGQPARLLGTDVNGSLFAFDLGTGSRSIVASGAVGTGPALSGISDLAVHPSDSEAFAVSGSQQSITRVDLLNGNRTLISGPSRGSGPRIRRESPRLAVDFDLAVAYVTSNSDSILTVDLVTGERVITAR